MEIFYETITTNRIEDSSVYNVFLSLANSGVDYIDEDESGTGINVILDDLDIPKEVYEKLTDEEKEIVDSVIEQLDDSIFLTIFPSFIGYE